MKKHMCFIENGLQSHDGIKWAVKGRLDLPPFKNSLVAAFKHCKVSISAQISTLAFSYKGGA